MLNEVKKTDLFCDYYEKWIKVYKEGAIRKVTLDKYKMTQAWLKKLAPTLTLSALIELLTSRYLTITQSITNVKLQWTFIINLKVPFLMPLMRDLLSVTQPERQL